MTRRFITSHTVRSLAGSAALIASSVLAGPAAGATSWSQPTSIPTSTDYAVARIASSADGRSTVAWTDYGSSTIKAVSRVVTLDPTGRPSTPRLLPRVGTDFVARDGRGNVLVGADRYEAGTWLVPSARNWRSTPLSDTTVSAAFGLADGGFVLAAGPRSNAGPTGVYTQGVGRVALSSAPRTVPAPARLSSQVAFDAWEYGFDDSTWARTRGGSLVSFAEQRTPDGERAPVFVRLGAKEPSVSPISGVPELGVAATDAAGHRVAIAGIAVDLDGDAGRRGRPAYALGTASGVGPARLVPGVPPRRSLEVDVAARPDGGAVVTWLQKQRSDPWSREGRPMWATIAPDGSVERRGRLGDEVNGSDLRVVRAGGRYVALWIRRPGTRSSVFRSALIGDGGARLITAPQGNPVGRIGASTSTQLAVAGGRGMVVYVDRTKTVRVSRLVG